MKKTVCVLACVFCMAAVLTAQAGTVQKVTLSELKQQMPDRLQMTVTTTAGDVIEVDAPILLPETDTLPVVVVQRATFDTTNLHDVFPFPDFYNREYSKGMLQSMLKDDRPGNNLLVAYAEEKRGRLSGRVDSTCRGYLPPGETPPGNDVTVEEIMAFITDTVRRFNCDTEPDIRVVKAHALTGLYHTKRIKTPEGWTEYTIDETKPVKNAGKGAWELELAQYMYGVRIFDDYLPYSSYLCPNNPNDWNSPVWLPAKYLDDKTFNILLCLVKEKDILIEDAPLLSYESLVQTLQNRMKEGKLHSIYQLTLGYTIKIVKGDSPYLDDARQSHNMDARFVLTPGWEIIGFDEKNGADAKSVGLEAPTKEMVLEPERYSRYGLTYNVRMDADTGRFLLDWDALEYDLAE